MRELLPEERQLVLGLIQEAGLGAVLNALATDWEEQADALQMEAAATYDSAKLQAAQALREIATGLRAVIDEHLQAFDELIDEGLPDAA